MVAAGQIRRLSKGRFYKLQISEKGELQPDTFQLIKDLIERTESPLVILPATRFLINTL